jgi:hypothetical protein
MADSERLDDILQHLRESGRATADYFRALRPEEWETIVFSEGTRWRVREMMAHFSTIEASMHTLFEGILAGGPGTPEGFDLDRFNHSQTAKIAGLDPQELIARFEAVREGTIHTVEAMHDADLDRTGRHPFLGEGNLERFVRWAYGHTALHEAEVRSAVGHSPITS